MNAAKNLHSTLIEACELLFGNKNLRVQISTSNEEIVLAVMDSYGNQLESMPFDGDSSDCLLSLANQIHESIEEKVEELNNEFEEDFNSEAGELREHLDGIEISDWRDGLVELREKISESLRKLDGRCEKLDEAEELEKINETLGNAIDEFEKHASQKIKRREEDSNYWKQNLN